MRNEKNIKYSSHFLVLVFAIALLSACRFPGTGLDGLEDESDSTTAPEFAFIANTNSATVGSDFSVAPIVLKAKTGEIASCEVEPGTTSLPPGLSLNPTTCAISGRPAIVLEETTFSFLVRNTVGKSSKASLRIRVMPGYPSLGYATGTVTGTVGVAFSHSPTELNSNGGSITFCGVKGGTTDLPSGLSIHPSTCVISGVPVAVQPTTTYLLEATNATGQSQPVFIYVAVAVGRPALSYTSSTGTAGTVGVAMSVSPSTLTANGAAISACGIKSGTTALPAALSVNAGTCVISGTPSAALASTSYTLVATTSGGVSDDAVVSLSVGAAVPTLSYASSTGKIGTVGASMSVAPSMLASNGASVTACSTKVGTTALPGYLSVHATTCVISGTPTATLGSTVYTLVATNSAGNSAEAIVTLSVRTNELLLTWVGGTNGFFIPGTYGTKGVAAPTNYPGMRDGAATCFDPTGKLWLFGGGVPRPERARQYDSGNDLWMFNGTEWTWVSGTNTPNVAGVYGIKGVAAPANEPGARYGHAMWCDSSNAIWIFGGRTMGTSFQYNDVWKFDGANWTWVSGDSFSDALADYGTIGVESASNRPGCRANMGNWVDASGNFWFFGGEGCNHSNNNGYYLQDLWRYNPTSNLWTWMSGTSNLSAGGVYGTQGVADVSNIPGGRYEMTSSTTSNGDLLLFGGRGCGETAGQVGYLNDLWKYDLTLNSWTWISGSTVRNDLGSYGTVGVTAPSNLPPPRSGGTLWAHGSSELWLFGGGLRNDLWKFDGTDWTWAAGTNYEMPVGTYGTKGVGSSANIPGASLGRASAVDSDGKLWTIGGSVYSDFWTIEIP